MTPPLVTYGVPQESFFGPLLFLKYEYISDIEKAFKVNAVLYVDDINLHISEIKYKNPQNLSNDELKKLTKCS